MRLAIDHRLTLAMPQGVSQAVFHLLLTPPNGATQTVESWSIDMPGIDNAGRFVDGFGNVAHLVNQTRPEGDVVIKVKGTITTRDTHGVLGRPAGEPVPALYRRVTPATKAPSALYSKFRTARESRLEILHGLMARVGELLGIPEQAQTQTQMQAHGGQAQAQASSEKALPPASDYAQSFIGAARALDIPARHVVGYRFSESEPALLHAWAEAFDDKLGWIGFDPSRQMCPTDAYIRLAIGLDAETAVTVRTVPAVDVIEKVSVSIG